MRKILFIAMCAALFTLSAISQETKGASNRELLSKGKLIYVKSKTYFVKKSELERGLLNNKDLERMGIQVTQNERDADFVLFVKRAAFQNFFPYTLTDRNTGKIVLAGEPSSLGGTVPGKIARDIANKLKSIDEQKEKK